MPSVIRTDQAEDDLVDILVYIGARSQASANRFASRVDQACQLLAQFPQMGTGCQQYGAGMRYHPVGKYVVFYHPVAGGIEVLRIVHGSRDIPALFKP